MVRRGQRQPGALIKSAGRAPRIALASIPASPVAAAPHSFRTAAALGRSPAAEVVVLVAAVPAKFGSPACPGTR
jgi:hypothetical protein